MKQSILFSKTLLAGLINKDPRPFYRGFISVLLKSFLVLFILYDQSDKLMLFYYNSNAVIKCFTKGGSKRSKEICDRV